MPRQLQTNKPFGTFPKGYRFNDEEAKLEPAQFSEEKKDAEGKVLEPVKLIHPARFVLSLSGPTVSGGNTVEFPADIVEDYPG